MALTRPGKILATVVTLLVVVGGGLFAYTKLTGNSVGPIGNNPSGSGEVPKACPLTGVNGDVPNRPVLAVKIENAPAARPQAGLEKADIVYEEPVEGNLTRFIAVFQCQDAERVGPIRSVRPLVDAEIVRQYAQKGSKPLVAHSGGIPEIVAQIGAAGLRDMGFDSKPSAYVRDLNRDQPHNLYSTTADLYDAADGPTGLPPSLFNYDAREPTRAKPGTVIHVPFATDTATDTNVFWKWNAGRKGYFRLHGDTPHKVETGQQLSAKNVILQFVQTRPTEYVDPNGVTVQEVGVVGQGRAIVFRNGKAIEGTWVRQFPEDRTIFKDSQGREVDLAPGNTWVELVPESRVEATFS